MGTDNASAYPLFLVSSLKALIPKTSVGDSSRGGCGLGARGAIIHFADLTAWSTLCSYPFLRLCTITGVLPIPRGS